MIVHSHAKIGYAIPAVPAFATILNFVITAIVPTAVWYRVDIAALRRIFTPNWAVETHAWFALVLELIWQAPVGIVRDRKASV